MSSMQSQQGAAFEHNVQKQCFSLKRAPKYYRTDWKGVDLPRRPSLRLIDDESFFQHINCDNLDATKKKHNRFLDFVSKAGNVSASKKYHVIAEQECEVSAKKHTPVPLHVRKSEIELIQRKLPRYPSRYYLSDPSFYPLASCDLFEIRQHKKEAFSTDLPEKQERKKEVSLSEMDKDYTTTTEIKPECIENEKNHSLPKTEEREKEVFLAQMDEGSTSTTDIETECLEDEQDHGLPETQEHEIEASSAQIDEDNTSITEFEAEFLEDEQDYDLSAIPEQIESSAVETDEDNTSTADIEIDHFEDEEEFLDESYYSDSVYSEELEMEVDDIFQELLLMKTIHSRNIENIDQQLSNSNLKADESIEGSISNAMSESLSHNVDDIIEGSISNEMSETSCLKSDRIIEGSLSDSINESSRSYVYEPYSSIGFSPQLITEDEPHERKIGFVPPIIRCMVFQARMEQRGRKIPEEHRRKFKPSLAQASKMGQATRLDEFTVIARGRKYAKYDPGVLPSVIWVKGEETVSLPTFHDRTPPQFITFKEACALGGIKALKPKITTNYDRFETTRSLDDDEVVLDDLNTHKRIRTRYLTEMYLHEERSYDDDDDFESVHYESLDDVELPTDDCPVSTCIEVKTKHSEFKDLIAQQVAEAVWERRYRLERPRAKQRIKYRCDCKYCKTSSKYQTFAYRKRWLIQQNLWKEPPPDDPIRETDLGTTTERPMDDSS